MKSQVVAASAVNDCSERKGQLEDRHASSSDYLGRGLVHGTPTILGRQRGITFRTALLTWIVTGVTLLIFVIGIIPQQKRSFEENLRSKAIGIAVSLRDVAAGATITEDYSSVVDHCVQILDGDESIDYLVITRSDGDSQIFQRQKPRWRTDKLDATWRPERRERSSGIGTVPLFHRRAFQFSQPFDYSGIQWGWIHVGLSLNTYDRSVANVYWRTSILALFCLIFGLAASVIHAKHLVKPILCLQSVVRRVADGDLSVRAQANRSDELGTLARSVNSMSEALLRRDRILQSVRFAAQEFLSTPDWKQVIQEVLARIGVAAEVSRLRVFQNGLSANEERISSLRYTWVAPGVDPDVGTTDDRQLILQEADFEPWARRLQHRQLLAVNLSELDAKQQATFKAFGFKSLLMIPIMVEKTWWGFLSLSDCGQERQWMDAECDSLRAVAEMLGAAIERQRTQDAIVEAKETLELRVQQRTRELQELVAAKERAHMELAEAQTRLLQTSRQAGMAEVATGVLHNVGNVLNSINVSATLVRDRLRKSEITSLCKVTKLIRQNDANLGAFLTADPKGKLIPAFLSDLGEALQREHLAMAQEHEQLSRNIEHVKEIVATQQSYARVSGLMEQVTVSELVDDAIRMNQAGLTRHGIHIERCFTPVPMVTIDKHKLLQILVNLIHNAKYALDAGSAPHKQVTIEVAPCPDDGFKIVVSDNGVGIAPENLTRIFSHGFTTRKDGHGFGLHSGANAAKEMGGSLLVSSEGLGHGATFTLQLPIIQQKARR